MEWLGIIVSKVVNMGGLHREGEVIIKILNNSGPRNEPCWTPDIFLPFTKFRAYFNGFLCIIVCELMLI